MGEIRLVHAVPPFASHLCDEDRDQRSGGVRTHGHCTEMLEGESIPANIGLCLEKEVAGRADGRGGGAC
jgi:hypothetical protein